VSVGHIGGIAVAVLGYIHHNDHHPFKLALQMHVFLPMPSFLKTFIKFEPLYACHHDNNQTLYASTPIISMTKKNGPCL
jgi:hypothetical protein